MFGTILILISTFMHLYVFQRLWATPLVAVRVPRYILVLAGVVLWAGVAAGRYYGRRETGPAAVVLETIGLNWLAVLFLLFVCLLALDLVTGFGFFMPRISPVLRGWAVVIGLALAGLALVQGLRPPVVTRYEVVLPGLPKNLDKTVLVAMSDLHLGGLRGERWLEDVADRVEKQQPDMVVLVGDIFEGHRRPSAESLRIMRRLSQVPLGGWAVLGNHEFHEDVLAPLQDFKEAGFTVLRDQWVEVRPGLILAGVDDLTTSKRRRLRVDNVSKALSGRPAETTILLSHTPWEAERVAEDGVNLMLCGHTHGGQIWPLDYLIKTRYPFLEGRFEVKGMSLIVSRGAGVWGPSMRLWQPGEIVRITLRSPE